MEEKGGIILPIGQHRRDVDTKIETEKRSVIEKLLDSLQKKATILLEDLTPTIQEKLELDDDIKENIGDILRGNNCYISLSNEVFEEIIDYLDVMYSEESDKTPFDRQTYLCLYGRCKKLLSGKKICDELKRLGIFLPDHREIKRLAFELNRTGIVPKIICFMDATDPTDRLYVACEIAEPLFARYARLLHKHGIV